MSKCSKANHKNSKEAKKKRQNYSPNKLKTAKAEVHAGKLPVAQISRFYNIPRSTLITKSSGKRPETYRRPGPQALLGKCILLTKLIAYCIVKLKVMIFAYCIFIILGEDVETKICEWLIQCGKSGFPISKNGLQFTVEKNSS